MTFLFSPKGMRRGPCMSPCGPPESYPTTICNLSALDAMMVLYHQVLRDDDVFILSKGHAAGALYVTMWTAGKLSDDDLKTFHGEGTRLAAHPAPGWSADIPFATGSLGHGLPDKAGIELRD